MKINKISCEKAKNISILKTLENLGHFPKKETEREAWFLSPFRDESNPSFKVNLLINRWYDHGAGIGGSIIDLIMQLYNYSVRDALHYLSKSSNIISYSFNPKFNKINTKEKDYKITRVVKLSNSALINYLKSRKIDVEIAKKYCDEIHYIINDKNYFAIAFKNDSKGFEIRNKYFKGGLGKKNIKTINNHSDRIILFEGFFDFLSYLTLFKSKSLFEDYVILNSIALVKKAIPVVNKYREIIICFDNDKPGMSTSRIIKKNCKNVIDCSFVYNKCKDINEYLILNKSNYELH
jgi:DNA primase